ncbi:MAG: hypothetical protein KGH71_00935 [Candidatus Micrarchaeota archaeon]|nr:hypothetical protein [Candidatus Micrarchaeota archaeon]
MGAGEPWRVASMAYTSKFAQLYKTTHLNYHYLSHLLVGCAFGLDIFGALSYFRLGSYYPAPLIAIGALALFAFHKRKSVLSVQAYQGALSFALLNLAALLLMLVLL